MNDLHPIDLTAAVQAAEWHDLYMYEIIRPQVGRARHNGLGWYPAIWVNPSTIVFGYREYNSEIEANSAALRKVNEIMLKGK